MTNKLPTLFDRTALDSLFDRSIGFDRLFNDIFDGFMPVATTNTFPPYNIRKTEDGARVIEMAVAGYTEDDIDITIDHDVLMVSASKTKEEKEDSDSYVYKGIATRSFKQQFKLSNHAEIGDVVLKDGMLNITVHLNEPDDDEKPKRIPIISG